MPYAWKQYGFTAYGRNTEERMGWPVKVPYARQMVPEMRRRIDAATSPENYGDRYRHIVRLAFYVGLCQEAVNKGRDARFHWLRYNLGERRWGLLMEFVAELGRGEIPEITERGSE